MRSGIFLRDDGAVLKLDTDAMTQGLYLLGEDQDGCSAFHRVPLGDLGRARRLTLAQLAGQSIARGACVVCAQFCDITGGEHQDCWRRM